MLLALGPLVVDTTVRTVVVGVLDGSETQALAGADAAWLTSPTPDAVASVVGATGLPVGVTVQDPSALDALISAGAVAVECSSTETVDLAMAHRLALWCSPDQIDRALTAGVPAEQIVCEPGDARVPAAGVTVPGRGPEAWGEVVRAVHGGARVVRTDDVRSVRRVVTVLDRLAVARAAGREVTT